jgi:hypothetical protein
LKAIILADHPPFDDGHDVALLEAELSVWLDPGETRLIDMPKLASASA